MGGLQRDKIKLMASLASTNLSNRPYSHLLGRLSRGDVDGISCLIRKISGARKIVIASGFPVLPLELPEIDGVPCALTLSEVLRKMGKTVCIHIPFLERTCEGGFDLAIFVEFPSPAKDGKCRNYRGLEIPCPSGGFEFRSCVGIGDGGNEWGMGKLEIAELPADLRDIWSDRACDCIIFSSISELGCDALALGLGVNPSDYFETKAKLIDWALEYPLPDGVTFGFTHTLDGIPLPEYFDLLAKMVRVAQL